MQVYSQNIVAQRNGISINLRSDVTQSQNLSKTTTCTNLTGLAHDCLHETSQLPVPITLELDKSTQNAVVNINIGLCGHNQKCSQLQSAQMAPSLHEPGGHTLLTSQGVACRGEPKIFHDSSLPLRLEPVQDHPRGQFYLSFVLNEPSPFLGFLKEEQRRSKVDTVHNDLVPYEISQLIHESQSEMVLRAPATHQSSQTTKKFIAALNTAKNEDVDSNQAARDSSLRSPAAFSDLQAIDRLNQHSSGHDSSVEIPKQVQPKVRLEASSLQRDQQENYNANAQQNEPEQQSRDQQSQEGSKISHRAPRLDRKRNKFTKTPYQYLRLNQAVCGSKSLKWSKIAVLAKELNLSERKVYKYTYDCRLFLGQLNTIYERIIKENDGKLFKITRVPPNYSPDSNRRGKHDSSVKKLCRK